MKEVMHTLGSMGRSDVGYRMLAQRSYPSVSCWIEQGATTMWECWNGGGSHNHQVFSDFSAFLYKYIGGISPDESDPGFDHILLRPALTSGLSAVACSERSDARGQRKGMPFNWRCIYRWAPARHCICRSTARFWRMTVCGWTEMQNRPSSWLAGSIAWLLRPQDLFSKT